MNEWKYLHLFILPPLDIWT